MFPHTSHAVHRLLAALALSVALVFVSACGRKGPLYIPDEPQRAAAPQAEPAAPIEQ